MPFLSKAEKPHRRIKRFQNDRPLFGKTLATQYPIPYRQHLPRHVTEYNQATKHAKHYQQLKIMTLNINGSYLQKTAPKSRLYAYIAQVRPDICILIDTRLSTAPPPIPGYGIQQVLPAANGQCGIIALIADKWFEQTIMIKTESERIILLDLPKDKLAIMGVYLPPYAGADSTFSTHLRTVVATFQEYQHIGYKTIAMGDWNTSHPAHPRRHASPNDTAFRHASKVFNLRALPVQQANHECKTPPKPYSWSGIRNNRLSTSMIDFACTDDSRYWKDRDLSTLVDHVELGTDHHPIHTAIPYVASAKPTPDIYIPPFSFQKDMSALPMLCTLVYLIRHQLTRLLRQVIRTSENTKQAADTMYEVIVAFIVIMAMKAGVFKVKLTNDRQRMSPTCPKAIIVLAKQELQLKHRLLVANEQDSDELMNELRATVKSRESQYVRHEIETIIGSNIESEQHLRTRDFKEFWAKLNPKDQGQHFFEEEQGGRVTVNPDSRHQCGIVREAYNKLLNPTKPEPPLKVPRRTTYPMPNDRSFKYPNLVTVIGYKQFSKEGMDAIPMQLLAAILKTSPSPFLVFFNFLYWNDLVPQKMAAERAKLLPKKTIVTNPMQTRMIGVGNSLMNVYDGLHCERIAPALEEHMTGYVGGARRGRNIQDIIFFIRHSMWYANRKQLTLILSSTDMRKCFDTIPHNRIVEEIKQVMGKGHTTAYVAAQLKDRRINLQWQGVMLQPIETKVGTPQGRQVSGPITNAVFRKAPEKALATGVGFQAATISIPMTSYMDDMLSESTNVPATLTIHRELDTMLTEYAMTFNDSKHIILIITTAVPADLIDLIKEIQRVFPTATVQPATMRHLGAQYAYRDFNFNKFFEIAFGSMISKHTAVRLKGIFNGTVGPCTVRQIYVGLLRPVGTFICPVQPMTRKNYLKLKGFQNKMLKKALQLPISASKDLIHLVLGVPKLKTFLRILKFQWYTSRRFAQPGSKRYGLLQRTLLSEWDQLRDAWMQDKCTKDKKMRYCLTYEVCIIAEKYKFIKQFTHFLDSNVNVEDSHVNRRKMREYQAHIREYDWKKTLHGSQLIQSPIKRYVLTRCQEEYIRWKQFMKTYPELIDWKRVHPKQIAADYFTQCKHPFATSIIEELFDEKWLALPKSGQIAQAYFSLLFGWQQMQYRKIARKRKCPMCGEPFKKPANHVLYLCLLTHSFHMPQKLASILDENEEIRPTARLAKYEIAPGYTPARMWKLATRVAVKKEWWKTKDKDPEIQWELDLKAMVKALGN